MEMQVVGKGMEILDCEGHSLVIRIVDLGWHTTKSSKGLAKPLSQTLHLECLIQNIRSGVCEDALLKRPQRGNHTQLNTCLDDRSKRSWARAEKTSKEKRHLLEFLPWLWCWQYQSQQIHALIGRCVNIHCKLV